MFAALVQGPLLRLIPIGIVLLSFQRTLFTEIEIAGVVIQIVLAFVVTCGAVGGSERGAIAGFVLGSIFDLIEGLPLGTAATAMTVAGVVAGLLALVTPEPSWWLVSIAALIGGAVGEIGIPTVRAFVGVADPWDPRLWRIVPIVAVGCALARAAVHRAGPLGTADPAERVESTARRRRALSLDGRRYGGAPGSDVVLGRVAGRMGRWLSTDVLRVLGVLALVAAMLFGLIGTRLWFVADRGSRGSAGPGRPYEAAHRSRSTPSVAGSSTPTDGSSPTTSGCSTVGVEWDLVRRESQRLEIFRRLSGWVGVPVEEMEARFERGIDNPFLPLPVAAASPSRRQRRSCGTARGHARCRDHGGWPSGCTRMRRSPATSSATWVASPAETKRRTGYLEHGYAGSTNASGQFGVELSMEHELRGKPGLRRPTRSTTATGSCARSSGAAGRRARRPAHDRPRPAAVRRTGAARRSCGRAAGSRPYGSTRRRTSRSGSPEFPEDVPFTAPAGSVVVMNHDTGPRHRAWPATRRSTTDGSRPDVLGEVRAALPAEDRERRPVRSPGRVDPGEPGDPGSLQRRLDLQAVHRLRRARTGLLPTDDFIPRHRHVRDGIT